MTTDQIAELESMLNPENWVKVARYLRLHGMHPENPITRMTLRDGTPVEVTFSAYGDAVVSLRVGDEMI